MSLWSGRRPVTGAVRRASQNQPQGSAGPAHLGGNKLIELGRCLLTASI